jgi:hypothetical protein
MEYKFQMMMMKSVITDEFKINKEGQITKFIRTRGNK